MPLCVLERKRGRVPIGLRAYQPKVALRRSGCPSRRTRPSSADCGTSYYGKRNDEILEDVVSPDYAINIAWAGWSRLPTRGPECIRGFIKLWWAAFPDVSFTIEEMMAEGDRVGTVITCRGTHQGVWTRGPYGPIEPTGRQFILPTMIVSRIADGKIVEEWESVNWASLWRQLGAVPTPIPAEATE